ncbi:hypothetical protein CR983_04390 [Candidatus Saccharibacteria bacterium]|nr:MAG: hypothetical protein CR983_04390 [Candidatus Saccharibacteria bacterium]
MGIQKDTPKDDGYTEVYPYTPKVTNKLAFASVYRRTKEVVSAIRAQGGECIDTTPGESLAGAKHTAEEGDWIVVLANGEQFIVDGGTFSREYKPSEKAGVYETYTSRRVIKDWLGNPIVEYGDDGTTAVVCGQECQVADWKQLDPHEMEALKKMYE